MSNKFLMEAKNLKQIGEPVDMNTAAITGARLSMAKGDRVSIILSMSDSVGAVCQFTLRQHNAASAGTSKDLAVANPYYHKAGAATSFTKVQPTVAAALHDVSSIFAAEPGILVLEVLSEQLDNENGYNWVSVDVADSTAAKILAGIMVVSDCRFSPAYSEAI